MIAPLPPDIIRHLVTAFAAIGPDAAQAAIEGVIRAGIMGVAEGRSLFQGAMLGCNEDRGYMQ